MDLGWKKSRKSTHFSPQTQTSITTLSPWHPQLYRSPCEAPWTAAPAALAALCIAMAPTEGKNWWKNWAHHRIQASFAIVGNSAPLHHRSMSRWTSGAPLLSPVKLPVVGAILKLEAPAAASQHFCQKSSCRKPKKMPKSSWSRQLCHDHIPKLGWIDDYDDYDDYYPLVMTFT